jgi:hypothetical protein
MADRSLFSRITGGAYLVLAITLSGVLPVAEARAVAASPATAHVEEPGDRNCPPIHDHGDCTICRTLRLVARGEAAPAFESGGSRLEIPPVEPAVTYVLLRLGDAWRSRAPPSV